MKKFLKRLKNGIKKIERKVRPKKIIKEAKRILPFVAPFIPQIAPVGKAISFLDKIPV